MLFRSTEGLSDLAPTACDADRSKIRQTLCSPGIKCRQQHRFGPRNGGIIVLTKRLRCQRAPLLACPGWWLEEICPTPILQRLSPAISRQCQSGSQGLHASAAKFALDRFCPRRPLGATNSSMMALAHTGSLDLPMPRKLVGGGASPRETASINSRTLLKSRYAANISIRISAGHAPFTG